MSNWHGFQQFLDFAKASIAIGLTVGTMLWGVLVYALDERYASSDLTDLVHKNSQQIGTLTGKVDTVIRNTTQIQIIRTKELHCKGGPEAQRYATEQLAQLVSKYNEVYHAAPFVPACEDL